jgi:hypothetical protein
MNLIKKAVDTLLSHVGEVCPVNAGSGRRGVRVNSNQILDFS